MRLAVVAAVAFALIAAVAVYQSTRPDYVTYSALFTGTSGVYEGNKVDVLGMKVGRVVQIIPNGKTNRVVMRVDKSVQIPANAHAVILQDSLIADRHIAFTPAYTGGPTLAPGTELPLERSHSPVGFNELIASIDQMLAAFSGKEVSDGVSELVAMMSKQIEGYGTQMRQIITGLSGPVATFAANDKNLEGIIKNGAALLQELAKRDDEVRAFSRDITSVTRMFAEDSEELRKTLEQMGGATVALASFVRKNNSAIRQGLDDTSHVIALMADRKRELEEVLDEFPLAMVNIINVRDPDTGQPVIMVNGQDFMRYNVMTDQFCGTQWRDFCDTFHRFVQSEDDWERLFDPNAGRTGPREPDPNDPEAALKTSSPSPTPGGTQ